MIKINDQEFDEKVIIEALQGHDYIVRQKNNEEEYLNNIKKLAVEEREKSFEDDFKTKFNARWREHMTSIETPLYEMGFKKEEGETGDQFALRVARSSNSKISELNSTVKQLQENKGDELLKSQISSMEKAVEELKKNHSSELETIKRSFQAEKINDQIERAIDRLQFSDQYSKEVIHGLTQAARVELPQKYKNVEVVDGEVRIIGENGVLVDENTAKPLNFDDILRTMASIKPFLKQNGSNGTGTNGTETRTTSGHYPSGAKSQYEVIMALKAQGFDQAQRAKILAENQEAFWALPE